MLLDYDFRLTDAHRKCYRNALIYNMNCYKLCNLFREKIKVDKMFTKGIINLSYINLLYIKKKLIL